MKNELHMMQALCLGVAPLHFPKTFHAMQALWLGVEPADLLLYVFLPPILLDSAARIDFFVFKKARPDASAQMLHRACVPATSP